MKYFLRQPLSTRLVEPLSTRLVEPFSTRLVEPFHFPPPEILKIVQYSLYIVISFSNIITNLKKNLSLDFYFALIFS